MATYRLGPKMVLSDRPVVSGHSVKATPMNATMTASVTTSVMPTSLMLIRLMSTRSRATPMSGAMTSRQTPMAQGPAQCSCTRSCQYTNAMSIPIAPWAKLNTPLVV